MQAEIRFGDLVIAASVLLAGAGSIVSVTLAYARLDKRIALVESQVKPFVEWFEHVMRNGYFAKFEPANKARATSAGE